MFDEPSQQYIYLGGKDGQTMFLRAETAAQVDSNQRGPTWTTLDTRSHRTRGPATELTTLLGAPSTTTGAATEPRAPRSNKRFLAVRRRALRSAVAKASKAHKKATHARRREHSRTMVQMGGAIEALGTEDSKRMQQILKRTADGETEGTWDRVVEDLLMEVQNVSLESDGQLKAQPKEREPFVPTMPNMSSMPARAQAEVEAEEAAFIEMKQAAMLAGRPEMEHMPRLPVGSTATDGVAFGQSSQLGTQKRPSARTMRPRDPPQSADTTDRPASRNATDPWNVFYQPHWNLPDAANQLWLTIEGAHGACKRWTNDYTPEYFQELMHKDEQLLQALQTMSGAGYAEKAGGATEAEG